MALDEGDKAICAEIAREIVEEVSSKVMKIHLETCPHGRLLSKTRARIKPRRRRLVGPAFRDVPA